MKFYCYDDQQSRWGRMLFLEAKARGYDAVLFTNASAITDPGYAFFRVEQFPPRLEPCKRLAREVLAKPGIVPIQTLDEIADYEDKVRQSQRFADYMPDFRYRTTANYLDADILALGLPVISKAKDGSSCANVRVLNTVEAARQDAKLALGSGINFKRHLQQGYYYWQQFLPDNQYIYRVVAIGRYRWMFREWNRPGLLVASGSGLYDPITPDTLSDECRAVLADANDFFAAAGTNWCGIDVAYCPIKQKWLVLETTLAWGMYTPGSSPDCAVFDANGDPHPKGYLGADIWKLLLDEVEAGVW